MRFLVLVSLVLAIAASAAATAHASFTKRGTVVRVVDGDTLDVRLRSGAHERVRLIGIDTPEAGTCYAGRATRRARTLAGGRRVVLRGDRSQDVRDRYGRLLAYVGLPARIDLARRLVLGGFGRVYVYERRFARLARYRGAERTARRLRRGIWGACARRAAPGPSRECHPSYSPCLGVVVDLDCGQIAASKKPIRVRGSDPYRLDGDGDGWGCE